MLDNLNLKNDRGMTLVEILASLVILSILIISFLALFGQSAKQNKNSEQVMDATYVAQEYDELEQMERIFIMDSIEFTAPDEVTTEGIEEKSTTWKVSFYRDDLDNLLDEVPKVNAPLGSQKLNPFPYNYGHEEGEE